MDELQNRIVNSVAEVCPDCIIEVGGIDRPLLSRSDAFIYVGVDIEERERCYEVYDRFIVQSIEQPLDCSAKLIVSTTLLEHVPNNKAAITSIARALEPGGVTHHYIPSKWHPYSILLRMVGPTAQKILIKTLRPGAADVTGYAAYFDRCTTWEMRKLLAESGLEKIETTAYYRANDYFAFFVPAFVAVTIIENLCRALHIELFASGFLISAVKPENSG